MTRRELLVLGAGTIALPRTVRAQQRAIPLVGVLRTATAVNDQGIDAFRRGLRELGYVEGHNILVEVRWSGGDNERLPALAAELAALKPDVIVANGEQAISAVGLCAKPRSPWRQSYRPDQSR
jgi:putative ABC transport system substrate-binding protein